MRVRALYCDHRTIDLGGLAMRLFIIAAALVALAAPASSDTLQEVTAHGIQVTTPDISFDVAYTAFRANFPNAIALEF